MDLDFKSDDDYLYYKSVDNCDYCLYIFITKYHLNVHTIKGHAYIILQIQMPY